MAPPKKSDASGNATAATTTIATTTNRATAAAKAVSKRKADDGDASPPAKRARSASAAPAKAKAGAAKPAKAVAKKPAKKTAEKTAKKAATPAPKPAPKPAAAPKAAAAPAAPKPPKPAKALPVVNHAPTEVLDVFVCGEGGNGELGLGTSTGAVDVKRPRLNPFLPSDKVRVVQVATGGMHVAALTADNKIYTWGVNDDGALGRGKTDANAKLVNQNGDDGSDNGDDDDDNGLNPSECLPKELPAGSFPPGTVITQLAAGDSITLALTAEGLVYGWGVFRDNNGTFGFSPTLKDRQYAPVLIEGLSKVTQIACGDNHCVALTQKGDVYCWGAYEASQLGRRVIQRHGNDALRPTLLGLRRRKIKTIGSGSFHSFAVDEQDRVYAWGLNNAGQTGIKEHAGEDSASIQPPQQVTSLAGRKITQIKGGSGHTIALDASGAVYVWGKADGGQLGVDLDKLAADDTLKNGRGDIAVVTQPTRVPDLDCAYVTCGTDHNIAVTKQGQAYSWGMSANYQTGLGRCDEDVRLATLIDNTAVRGRKLLWAGAGGQYSAFAASVAK